MQHYVTAIISLGSADAYSTESPERLHIDFTKSAYWASNKKNYIKQMTKWLSCQEACHRFANYLQWTIPGYIAELTAVYESKDDDEELKEDKGDNSDDSEQDLQLGYSIVKQSAYSRIAQQLTTLEWWISYYISPNSCRIHHTLYDQPQPHSPILA
jgi:hypothetical protein